MYDTKPSHATPWGSKLEASVLSAWTGEGMRNASRAALMRREMRRRVQSPCERMGRARASLTIQEKKEGYGLRRVTGACTVAA